MSLTSHRLGAPLLVACLTASALALPLSSGAGAAQARVVVAGAVAAPRADRVVATPITTSFDVVLALANPTGLSRYLTQLTTPASPNYRRFLTPRQFGRLFGASATNIARVRRYLEGYGLRVASVNSARSLMRLVGRTPQIARAFATPVETLRTSSGLRAQFTRPATLPASLASAVTTVVGLSSVAAPSSHAVAARTSAAASRHPHVATATTCSGANNALSNPSAAQGSFNVQQQAQLYGLSAAWAQGKTGVGQTIAVYELAKGNTSNLTFFFNCYGLSPSISTVNVDNGPTGGLNDEATMDVEEAGALAPGAALEIYQAPNTASAPVDLYARIASDDTASIVSTSWGTCEQDPTGAVQAEQVIFEQMAAQGQTVVAAAGDLGSSDCNGITNNAAAVDDPASQPFVTGVGALTVSSISPLSQSVWNSAGGSAGGASGGGQSQIWSRPTWQSAPGIDPSTQTMRMVPDLSVMGDPNTGFVQYYTDSSASCQGWCSIGGTSIGAPLVSALVATAAQVCNTSRLGFLNPTLYRLARAATGFNDVTVGNNDLFAIGQYAARAGYDMASGLGSPTTTFEDQLCPSAVDRTHSALVSASPVSYAGTASHFIVALRDANANPIINSGVTVIAKAPKGVVSIDSDPTSIKARGKALATVISDTTGDASFTLSSSLAQAVTLLIKLNGVPLYSTTVNFRALPLTRQVPATPQVTRVLARHRGALVEVASSHAGTPFVVALQVSVDGGASWHSYPAHVTAILVNGLKGRTTYVLRLRARNANGVSPVTRAFRVTSLS